MSSLTESCTVFLNRADARGAVDAFGVNDSAIVYESVAAGARSFFFFDAFG